MATKKNSKTFEDVLEQEGGAVVTTLENVMEMVDDSNDVKSVFINENIGFVPDNKRNVFETWDIDKQYAKLSGWKTKAEWRAEMAELNKIENKVRDLFIKRKVTIEEVERVIEFCKSWIKDAHEHDITLIDEEIERLTERRNNLTAC